MWDRIFEIGDRVIRLVGELDRQQWIGVFVVVVVVGLYCMRGFGSRQYY